MKAVTLLTAVVLVLVEARPPTRQESAHPQAPEVEAPVNETLDVEYNRYLQEVVQVLESDPEFRKKLEDSKPEEIRDGTIAKELEFLHHSLRTRLDEVKSRELDRLRKLAVRQYEAHHGIDHQNLKMPQHLDLTDLKFRESDLRKLIKATTDDLEEADRQRREEFKRYEMEKKFEEQERLRHIEKEDDRKKEEQRLNAVKTEHKKHEKLHHPMSKDQLEEVSGGRRSGRASL